MPLAPGSSPPSVPAADPSGAGLRASAAAELDAAKAPPPAEPASDEDRALGWAALAAAAAIVWLVMPVGVGILLGAMLAFMIEPGFARLRARWGERWSAMAAVLLATAVMAGAAASVAWLFVAGGSRLSRQLLAELGPGGGGAGLLDGVGAFTRRIGIPPDELTQRARALVEEAATRVAAVAGTLVAATADALLALFFAMLAMHYILRHWQEVIRSAQRTLPLRPAYTAALLAEFRTVGRTTLLGTVATGLAQGLFATVAFAVSGVPQPLFFGVATALASLIPAVGTLLVWVPIGVVLIVTGHPARGALELGLCAASVVGVSDYVIRPRLVGEEETPVLVTFVALFGGVEVFGLKGLILGPVVLSLALAVLRLYARRRRRGARAPAGAPRPAAGAADGSAEGSEAAPTRALE